MGDAPEEERPSNVVQFLGHHRGGDPNVVRDPKPMWDNAIALVEELLAELKAGTVKPDAMVVTMREKTEENGLTYEKFPVWSMGFSRLELLGITIEMQQLIP